MSRELIVADSISPFKLILNQGLDDGIALEDRFVIYALGKSIKDPTTGVDLERLEIIRGTGRIVHLQKKISTIESTEVESKRVLKSNSGPFAVFTLPTEETRLVPRPFDEAQIGDLARKI